MFKQSELELKAEVGELIKVNKNLYIKPRKDTRGGQMISVRELKRRCKRLGPVEFKEGAGGICGVFVRENKEGERSLKHLGAMPSEQLFTTIPFDEFYARDVLMGDILRPNRGWGSVVKLFVGARVCSKWRAKRVFPELRLN